MNPQRTSERKDEDMERDPCDKDSACGSCATAEACNEKQKKEHEDRLLEDTLSRIRHKIFVLGGKGGVGKSTVAVNLAASLAARGFETGLLDIDIHGPNVAKMVGLDGVRLSASADASKIAPAEPYPRLKVVSMAGLLPDSDAPVIWRGPLKMAAIRQFLGDVAWGSLDFLIVDSPPGTGDEPLSIAQLIPDADGVVIVTTPQEVALLDSRKCINFARQLKLPVLGIIENMSGLNCPHCNGFIPLFSQDGGRRAAKELSVPFLGALPIDPDMPAHCDHGQPHVLLDGANVFKDTFQTVVDQLTRSVGEREVLQ